MKVKRNRQFSAQFKQSAVEQSLRSTQSLRVVAGKLGVHPTLLSRWRCALTKRDEQDSAPVPNEGPDKSAAALARENRKLKKKLERAELENEILKKANEHFAKLQE
jgi:transposase